MSKPSRSPHSVRAVTAGSARSVMRVSSTAAPAMTMSARSGLRPGTRRRSSSVRPRSSLTVLRKSARLTVSSRCGSRPCSALAATAARLRIVPEVP